MYYYAGCMKVVGIEEFNSEVYGVFFKYKVITECDGYAFPYFTNKKYEKGDIFDG